MSGLTSAQLTKLQQWINANHAADVASGNIQTIATALVGTDPSNTQVYSPAVPTFGPGSIFNALVYAEFIALTAAQQNYFNMLMSQPTFDGTNANIQTAIGTMFGGKQTLTNFIALARFATVFELLFTTNHVVAMGSGGQSLYGYQPSQVDVQAAINGSY